MYNDYVLFGENEDDDIILDYDKYIDCKDKMDLYSDLMTRLLNVNGDMGTVGD